MTKRWILEGFDPYTRDRAHECRRLLFLDGPNIHTFIDILEACWQHNIVLFVVPVNMSFVFPPLDVSSVFPPLNAGAAWVKAHLYSLSTIDIERSGTPEHSATI